MATCFDISPKQTAPNFFINKRRYSSTHFDSENHFRSNVLPQNIRPEPEPGEGCDGVVNWLASHPVDQTADERSSFSISGHSTSVQCARTANAEVGISRRSGSIHLPQLPGHFSHPVASIHPDIGQYKADTARQQNGRLFYAIY